MKLIIVRHGETIENATKICQGHLGGNLSAEGKMQAKKLSQRLKNERIDVVYCSDLKRTKDTAKEIMKFHKNVPIFFDERIRERCFGKYQGTKYDPDWDWRSAMENPESTIENDEEMANRIESFLLEIGNKHKTDSVLIVTHGGVKKILFTRVFNKCMPQRINEEPIKNTSTSIFEVVDMNEVNPVVLNCVKHLEE